jgi:hypothetical protein
MDGGLTPLGYWVSPATPRPLARQGLCEKMAPQRGTTVSFGLPLLGQRLFHGRQHVLYQRY